MKPDKVSLRIKVPPETRKRLDQICKYRKTNLCHAIFKAMLRSYESDDNFKHIKPDVIIDRRIG